MKRAAVKHKITSKGFLDESPAVKTTINIFVDSIPLEDISTYQVYTISLNKTAFWQWAKKNATHLLQPNPSTLKLLLFPKDISLTSTPTKTPQSTPGTKTSKPETPATSAQTPLTIKKERRGKKKKRRKRKYKKKKKRKRKRKKKKKIKKKRKKKKKRKRKEKKKWKKKLKMGEKKNTYMFLLAYPPSLQGLSPIFISSSSLHIARLMFLLKKKLVKQNLHPTHP